jgi:hypothetical protein
MVTASETQGPRRSVPGAELMKIPPLDPQNAAALHEDIEQAFEDEVTDPFDDAEPLRRR